MLLRSSSTPVLGSLLSSFTDSPIHHHTHTVTIHPESCHNALKHLPPTTTSLQHHHHRLNLSRTSSPISPSVTDLEHKNKGFRRVQSEGNLEDLAFATGCNNEDRFNYMDPLKRYSVRQRCLALETIPSFILSKQTGLREEEEDGESDIEDEDYEFSVVNSGSDMMKDRLNRMSFGEEEVVGNNKEMYLAKGLGVDVCGDGIGGCRGGNGGGDYNSMGSGGNDGDNNHGVEEYYKKMLEENPGNPLFLRNYAQFLYQCKQDLEGAMEYYSRAILADPEDGEVLSQYGRLVWELHHDQQRASNYFERSIQASPEDSHVQAAYASFLWDTEEEEGAGWNQQQCLPQHFHLGAMATTGV
ncbi:uncharacterized protein [Cicer arietinum]|uniref:Uncharacterized protein LOC101502107 n=1 Tax=Cicer arietinum TaxID=3827 RepID=A0A1S2XSG4_CICAR|nr:uncharacterized protein LOC101502107 [Cicer arietinum]XP_004493827.1 uncharacterized protein LOC101502107 [Cicer arietinum]